jgi:hypothetical protein
MQPHEIDAGTSGRRAACRCRSTTSDKSLQLVPRKQIPQPQRRERNRLRPVRVETEQPGPNQAV